MFIRVPGLNQGHKSIEDTAQSSQPAYETEILDSGAELNGSQRLRDFAGDCSYWRHQ